MTAWEAIATAEAAAAVVAAIVAIRWGAAWRRRARALGVVAAQRRDAVHFWKGCAVELEAVVETALKTRRKPHREGAGR